MDCAIVWFRRDLRLADNPALSAALERYERIVPVYILSENEEHPWNTGGAQRVWLHFSLKALDKSLGKLGSRLIIRQGESTKTLQALVKEASAQAVFWNRLYEPEVIKRDAQIKKLLRAQELIVESFNAALLHEPWQVSTQDKNPYRIFTPYWRSVREKQVASVLPAADCLPPVESAIRSIAINALKLLPGLGWDEGIKKSWQPGEDQAMSMLNVFCRDTLADYPGTRDIPSINGTSGLSPYLHFGEISPRQIRQRITEYICHSRKTDITDAIEAYFRQLAWRDFAHHLLYHFPETPAEPMDPRFKKFQWDKHYSVNLRAWQCGNTGLPMVDAGMRELWHTGWMHNRVRMIAASFLVKNLLIPWQEGAEWFWDTLVDADLANNTMGWQWTSGCGVDAAPYFRVFNPVTQGKRFDPEGKYIRRWIPEIASLSDKFIHAPWEASGSVLLDSGICLGKDYPLLLVDLKQTRKRALEHYEAIK